MMTRAERRRAHDRLNELERLSSLREPDHDSAAGAPRFSVVINEQVRLEFEPEAGRGVFKSVDELKQAIMDYLDNHNGHPKPCV